MKKIAILIVHLFLLLVVPYSYANDFSSPESTLEIYINALRTGDKKTLLKCLHPIPSSFNLPGPEKIDSYSIKRKIVFGKKEVDEWNSKGIIPSVQIGDIDCHVEQIEDGEARMYSYTFRNISREWKIITFALWDQEPEPVDWSDENLQKMLKDLEE